MIDHRLVGFWWVSWVVGPQYLHVIPWHFENGASSRLMMFLLKMVDYSMSFLLLSTLIFFDGQVGWTILQLSYLLNFFVGALLHA